MRDISFIKYVTVCGKTQLFIEGKRIDLCMQVEHFEVVSGCMLYQEVQKFPTDTLMAMLFHHSHAAYLAIGL
jgi:hypothetical protein